MGQMNVVARIKCWFGRHPFRVGGEHRIVRAREDFYGVVTHHAANQWKCPSCGAWNPKPYWERRR